MIKSFIRQCVDEILNEPSKDYSEQMIVFPTRRACLFFKKEFSKAITKPLWAPKVISINEFMEDFSGLIIPDRLSLIFELFEVYKTFFKEEEFDDFYPWGQMLLNDFDEIDRSMINAHALFNHITDIKKIEGDFALDESDLLEVQKFWNEISGTEKDTSILKKEFLKIWDALNPIYKQFRKRLLDKKNGYEGLAFRLIAEEKLMLNIPYSKIIFAGFYAPSRAEQQVILQLQKKGQAIVWADADSYYTDQVSQEAGKFFRKKGIWDENLKWKANHFADTEKNIEITGVPLQYGQSRSLGKKLEDIYLNSPADIENTAVVLPDENMLFPILYAIPGQIERINVTMGYPLRNTPLYHLFTSMLYLLKNARTEKDNNISYYYKDVNRIIRHPYIMQLHPKKCLQFLKKMQDEGLIRVSSKDLNEIITEEPFSILFSKEAVTDIAGYFLHLISFLANTGIKEKKLKLSEIEKEYFFHFFTLTQRLSDLLKGANYKANIHLYQNLLLEIIDSSRIPFSGEPLNGLQIMGFLETRVLDFENLLIPSMNEGALPPASKKHSYIPYSIRKAYGLATFEDHDAIYSYHFYRLLQRAKNIYLYYDTEVKSLSGGEKSRYLLQLKYELSQKFTNIKFSEKLQSTSINTYPDETITIQKDQAVMDILEKYYENIEEEKEEDKEKEEKKEGIAEEAKKNQRSFSSTALNTYISCSLQFYFKYIAGIKEFEEVDEVIAAKHFGSIFHKAMEYFYQDQNEISIEFLEEQKEKLPHIINKAFKDILKGHDHETGKNLLVKSILTELIKRLIDNEIKEAPFQMMYQEKKILIPYMIGHSQRPIMLNGAIDRIDKKNDIYRILDYKTGKVKIGKTDISEFFVNADHKISLQAYFYGLLLKNEMAIDKIQIGIYPVKKPADRIVYFNDGEPIPDYQFESFEEGLKKLFNELYNPSIPFKQTEDRDKCTYCPYKVYCSR